MKISLTNDEVKEILKKHLEKELNFKVSNILFETGFGVTRDLITTIEGNKINDNKEQREQNLPLGRVRLSTRICDTCSGTGEAPTFGHPDRTQGDQPCRTCGGKGTTLDFRA